MQTLRPTDQDPKELARGILKLTSSDSNGLFELASTRQRKLKRKRLLSTQTR